MIADDFAEVSKIVEAGATLEKKYKTNGKRTIAILMADSEIPGLKEL